MPLKSNPPWNVLIFPAASEIGLEIHRALRDCKEVILHGANQPGESIAAFHFLRLHELPPIGDPKCLLELQRLIALHDIHAIFPAYDDVLLWLANNAVRITAEIITSDAKTCAICRSKSATYRALENAVDVPRVWSPGDPAIRFPVFVKPDKGQGSQRARRIDNAARLAAVSAAEPDLIVLEDLPGREFTVDCFSQNDRVLFAQARGRVQTKTGISTLTRAEHLPVALEWAERIAEVLDLRGPWFFQMKEGRDGRLRLLEVAPRIAGSMALSRVAGPNFPLLALYDAAGHKVIIDAFETGMPMGRSLDLRFIYDKPVDALYIDLDDTLVLRGQVNTRLMAIVFQCHNRGIAVNLVTRHKSDLPLTLEKFRMAQVFDRIIHIPDDATPKAQFITEENAVLIDDSFQERHAAFETLGIRCFDAAAAICLLDERG